MNLWLPILFIGAGYSEAAHREAAKRFVNHARSERALPVLRRWGQWSKTAEGRRVLAQLSALADDLLCGDITTAQYEQELLRLTSSTPMSQRDLEVLARHALEFCRCAFFGAGHVPTVDVKPADLEGAA